MLIHAMFTGWLDADLAGFCVRRSFGGGSSENSRIPHAHRLWSLGGSLKKMQQEVIIKKK